MTLLHGHCQRGRRRARDPRGRHAALARRIRARRGRARRRGSARLWQGRNP
jgi:hypothetical protein